MDNSPPVVWQQFSDALLRFIHSRVTDNNLAEDLRQEVFLKMLSGLDHLRDPARLENWLFRIAHNTVIDHYRRQGKSLPAEALHEVDQIANSDDELPDLSSRLRPTLTRMLMDLPAPYRETLRLASFGNMTLQQVADKQNLPLSTVKSRVQRGRKLLRDSLLACCEFEVDRYGKVLDYSPRPKAACDPLRQKKAC